MDEIRTQHQEAAVDTRPRPAPDTHGAAGRSAPQPPAMRRAAWVDWLTTTDHKRIGTLYLISAFVFFVVGGVMALMMRAELARPGLQIMSNEQFNQAFTMHGSIMLLMFAMPLFTGFANWIMP
ncbi:cbb3-type cytochrome c oxidase subunit I, partial [Actinospica acidiphila]|uniref:cbb3-type cytochrome c oxidase subunit I n=1 Tax=Actinospica acidiphila TaxID=304899 RepID=UPI003DA937D8